MIQFLAMGRNEIDALTILEALATPKPWTANKLKDSFDGSANCRVIKNGQNTIGYCVVQNVLDEAELLNIVIFRALQAKGYGRKAILKLKRDLTESGVTMLYLEVRASNAIAKTLYEKTGFEVINIRKNYYPADDLNKQLAEDALVMRCPLPVTR